MRFKDLRFEVGDGISWASSWCVSQPLHHPNTPKIVVIVSYPVDTPDISRRYDIDRTTVTASGRVEPSTTVNENLDKLELAAWLAEMVEAPGYPER